MSMGHRLKTSAQPLLCLPGERDEIAPGSTYKAPTFAAEERVVVRGLTRRRYLGKLQLSLVRCNVCLFIRVDHYKYI